MKKLITGALAVTLLASTAASAFAQDQGHHGYGRGQRSDGDGGGYDRGQRNDGGQPDNPGDRRHGGETRQAAPDPQPQAAPQPQPQREYNPALRRGRGNWPGEAQQAPPAPEARQAPPAPVAPRAEDPRRGGGGGRDWRDDRRGDDHRADDRRGDDRRWDNDRRGDDRRWDDNRWGDNRWADRDRPRYDRRAYPSIWRTPQRYRAPAYRPPSGWYARSWSYGQIIPRGWYGSQYRLMEWWDYGLPIPPLGYVWVRVGDDALLVDEYSGRIVQVVYDLFW